MSSDATKAENRRMILAARPQGMVDASTVRLETGPVPEPGPGQALVKVQWLSIDPTIRTWMDDRPGYLPPIALGEVVRGAVLGQVTASNSDAYAPGDMVVGMAGWQDWTLAGEGAHGMQVIPPGLEPGAVLNVFGVNGLTAYWGMLDVGRVQSGDIVVVSGAAGGVGSIAAQLAGLAGATVIGLASDAHHRWLTDHGVIPLTYGDGVADRIKAASGGRVDAFVDTFGGGYVEMAVGLGVAPDRIDTIIDPAAARRYGTKADGNAAAATAEVLGELAGLIADGRLEVPIARAYPLAEVREAFRHLEHRHTLGKIVLEP